MSLKCKSSVPRLRLPVTMSIFRCRWQRRLDWRAGRKFSGNCWSGVNYAWYDLRFQPPAEIGRSQRSVKVGFDTLSWASHPSESGNSPLKSRLSLHLLAGHHELIGLGESGCEIRELRAIGGGANSVFWTQLKADVIG